MINRKPKTSKFKKQSYINIKLGSFTSPSCHIGRDNESETFVLIFVIIHYSIMSRVLGSHGNESETFKNNYILRILLMCAHTLISIFGICFFLRNEKIMLTFQFPKKCF